MHRQQSRWTHKALVFFKCALFCCIKSQWKKGLYQLLALLSESHVLPMACGF